MGIDPEFLKAESRRHVVFKEMRNMNARPRLRLGDWPSSLHLFHHRMTTSFDRICLHLLKWCGFGSHTIGRDSAIGSHVTLLNHHSQLPFFFCRQT